MYQVYPAYANGSCCLILSYKPQEYYNRMPELKQAMDMIGGGFFSPENADLFKDIYNSLMYDDR